MSHLPHHHHSSTQHPSHQEQPEDDQPEFVADEDVVEVEELLVDRQPGDEPMDDENEHDHDGQEGDEDEDAADQLLQNGFDDSSLTFSEHQGAVFVLTLHPSQQNIAVSGGEDDLGLLFDTTTGEVLQRLEAHSDSVTSVGFSSDGEMVATGGMDGRVKVWARQKQANVADDWSKWALVQDLEGPDEVNVRCACADSAEQRAEGADSIGHPPRRTQWIDWHPKGNFLLAGGADGTVWMWKLPSGEVVHVLSGHTTPVTCGKWTPDGKFVTCSGDSTMILWDPRNGDQLHKLSPSDARFRLDGGVNCIAINPAATVAILGGAEGGLRAINLLAGTVLAQMQGHEEGTSVEQVAFSEVPAVGSVSVMVVVSVGTDGRVCTWEANSFKLRSTGKHEDAVTSLAFSPNTTTFVTGSADHTLKIWDYRRGTCEKTLLGHRDVVHACSVSKDGGLVVSAGEDGDVKVFRPFEERKDPLAVVGGEEGSRDADMRE
ncbi:BQ2448_8061 [Microbotryum intermedium]|uniref:BQ2448_8061 protein n=1 Tax=Microbotryum intermedium TaxID=269621 RepID=A0A238FKW5_9BASI|nr:BQ2448_8061 [Microbotryum intermedium]